MIGECVLFIIASNKEDMYIFFLSQLPLNKSKHILIKNILAGLFKASTVGCSKKSKFLVQISTTPNLVYINALGNQKKYQDFTSNIDRVPALLKIQRKFFKIQRKNEVARFSSFFLWK